jgi:hypothetical protein
MHFALEESVVLQAMHVPHAKCITCIPADAAGNAYSLQ